MSVLESMLFSICISVPMSQQLSCISSVHQPRWSLLSHADKPASRLYSYRFMYNLCSSPEEHKTVFSSTV